MAYVSIRVTPQSTARSVVLEVLPLLGQQVCAPPPRPCALPAKVLGWQGPIQA